MADRSSSRPSRDPRRSSLRLNSDLHRRLKILAIIQGRPLHEMTAEVLLAYVEQQEEELSERDDGLRATDL